MWLANDGNYREMRWFTPWAKPKHVEDFILPDLIIKVSGQTRTVIGDAVLETPLYGYV
jgi:NAD+ synthase (glutamine-hydrolysing)